MIQPYKAIEKPILLFCECLKRGKMSIYDITEYLECEQWTAKRHINNLVKTVDKTQFDCFIERSSDDIYNSQANLVIREKE